MSSAHPLRPRPTILALAVSGTEPSILSWLVDRGHVIAASEVRMRLRNALGFSADAYRAARFLEDRHGFPADEHLVRLLRRGWEDARKSLRKAVMEWVMETGIRFQQVTGDPVLFREDGVLLHGLVQTVRHETADAIVMVVDSFDSQDFAGAPVMTCVNAEDILPGGQR